MEVKIIHEVNIAYEFLKDKARYDYTYQFNNLEADQWEKVICFGLFDGDELKDIAMLVNSYNIPVLLAASFGNAENNIELIEKIKGQLPTKFYTHINKATLEKVFAEDNIYDLEEYMNMGLCNYDMLDTVQSNGVVRLGFKDIDYIKELLAVSHPGAWLDDDLVKLNENFGIYDGNKLISFAGIHAYSKQYQVAAVAHVTTRPEYREMGHAKRVVSALANSLREKIEFIGLNVRIDNVKAISCYKKLGFVEFGKFVACEIEMRG